MSILNDIRSFGDHLWTMVRPVAGPVAGFFRNRPKLLFFPVVGLGVLFFMLMAGGKKPPATTGAAERVQVARVITAPQVRFMPRTIGYGYIQPSRDWEAVAEVAGKITEMHPDLREGGIISQGEVLLRIDPVSSELAQAQSAADVARIEAQISELDQNEADLRRTLATEGKSLQLSRQELERYKTLIASGTIAKSELDAIEQQYLNQANAVQGYRTQLNQIPAQRAALEAQLVASQSKNADALRTVEKTVLLAPFDCRVSEVNVEVGQAVQVGKVLADLDTLGTAEAKAQVPLYAFRNLLSGDQGQDAARLKAFLGLEAVVRINIAGQDVEWSGTVSRIGDEVDPDTRTIGVFVAVDAPYKQAVPGERPPLIKNMYAEVELRGKSLSHGVVLPRTAVHDGVVYVVDADHRLSFRPVKVKMVQGDVALLEAGVLPGDIVVVSDLVPAIEGMLVEPLEDDALRTSVVAYSQGTGSVR